MTLYVDNSVYRNIMNALLLSEVEIGFMLGCSESLDRIDACCQIPSVCEEKCFYIPDTEYADDILKKWNEKGTCIGGFIHSHILGDTEMTEDDWRYAESIYEVFDIPYMWFGVVSLKNNRLYYAIYIITKDNPPVKCDVVVK